MPATHSTAEGRTTRAAPENAIGRRAAAGNQRASARTAAPHTRRISKKDIWSPGRMSVTREMLLEMMAPGRQSPGSFVLRLGYDKGQLPANSGRIRRRITVPRDVRRCGICHASAGECGPGA
ncbi:hypothetical protein SBRY_20167 [Actinacidiphila bryophytorum]|uniref:Uncharacterized protein n=1 Tax=Actinacidiphila bryophytorum TaxID=1436133 RepID=A0A9W4E5Z7_9ACTN|nr:hypothetical protein SBRY_20167 [Actinacidiphila bryophytorum]